MPRYFSHLGYLMESDVSRVSSMELAGQMNLTASQIRQDLNHFGCFGQQGYGYNVRILREAIGKILGLDREYGLIIIGAGNLGQALANYTRFENMGFVVKAVFDISPEICGRRVGKCVVKHIDELEDYTASGKVDIAALTLKSKGAQDVVNRIVKAGITAVWNFASFELKVPEGVIVEDVHLLDSLMMLSYNLHSND